MIHSKHILSNGIRLILAKNNESRSTTIHFAVLAGSRYETVEEAGISHFIEHMMFKGTENRPTTLDLSRELDGVGADYNAFTCKDQTAYYIRINSEKFDVALDVMSDMLTNSKFDATEIKKESEVIVEEIKMYQDNPLMHIGDLYEETIFKGNSLGLDIAGTKQSVRSMTRDQMKSYISRRYRGENIVITISGNIDDSIVSKIEDSFSKIEGDKSILESRPKAEFSFPLFDIDQKQIQSKIDNRETEQVQMVLGFPGVSLLDPLRYPSHLLSIVLGGNMSSRFFIKIREKLGLCYFIRASSDHYQDIGSFSVSVGLDKDNIPKAIEAVCNELKEVKDKGVEEEELQRAKDFIAGKFALSMENTSSVSRFFGDQELMKSEILTPEKFLQKINRVSLDEIKTLANKIFVNEKANLALIGPGLDDSALINYISL